MNTQPRAESLMKMRAVSGSDREFHSISHSAQNETPESIKAASRLARCDVSRTRMAVANTADAMHAKSGISR